MIIGHQKQWEFLKKIARATNPPHALLFSGEDGLLKKEVAIEFIKLLNCKNKDFNKRPCGKCHSCCALDSGTHPDFLLVEPVKSLISISKIRELNWRLALKPLEADYKTVIIDKCHLMNQDAQNALLKTLEEPKGTSLLILLSEYPRMLFPTVRSRVCEIKFFPVGEVEIKDFLKSQGASEKDIKEILRFSHRKPARAIDLLEHPQQIEDQKKKLLDIIEIMRSPLGFCFGRAKTLSEKPGEVGEILHVWLRYFRGLLLKRVSGYSESTEKGLSGPSLAKIKKVIKNIERVDFLLTTTNINPRIALEFLMVELKT